MNFKKVIVICGNYGSGKTTVAMNMALNLINQAKKVALIDLDLVNPYFRSSDYSEQLQNQGVRLVMPQFAGTTLDVPSINPQISGVLEGDFDHVIIDAGGDDVGATVLGCFAELIKRMGYDMIYVINKNREDISTPELALEILNEIEAVCHMKATMLVNNTHLCGFTDNDIYEDGLRYSREVSERLGLPVAFNAVGREYNIKKSENDFSMDIMVVPPWKV